MANTLSYRGSPEEYYNTHFLKSCFMCQKPLGVNHDIYMYMGITAFCSDGCRQEQIEIDEGKKKNWNLSASMRALIRKASPATAKSLSTTSTAANSTEAGFVKVA